MVRYFNRIDLTEGVRSMLGEHHSLQKEFPEYSEAFHKLKMNDAHFVKLLNEYDEVDKEVYRIEEQIETPGIQD